MFKTISLSFFLFFTTYSAIGQTNFVDGSIVNLKGDTIKGQIDYQEWVFNPKKIRFRKDNSSKEIGYTYKDIKAFRFFQKNEQYERAIFTIQEDPLDVKNLRVYPSIDSIDTDLNTAPDTAFLLVIARGRLNLYELQYDQHLAHYFVKKGSQPLEELVRRRVKIQNRDSFAIFTLENYKNQLRQITADCPIKKQDFTKQIYSPIEFLKIVTAYNLCAKESYYTKKEGKGSKHFSIMAGLMRPFSSIADPLRILKGPDVTRTDTSKIMPLIGFSFEQNYNRLRNRLGIGEEFNLTYVNKVVGSSYPYSNGVKGYSYSVSTLSLKANLYVRYYFKTERIQPYLKGGFGFRYYTNPKITLTEFQTSSFTYTNEINYVITKLKPNYLVSLGLKHKTFFMEARYEGGLDKDLVGGDIMVLRHASLIGGYIWNFNKKNK